MLQNWLKDYTLIITSQNNKKKILLSLTNEHKILDLKFMTKEEFFEKYYFKYDERAYFYLRQKYHYDLDVCKLYLKNLYFIENHPYQNTKLQRLKQIKDELIQVGLLEDNKLFHNYLKTRNIVVYHYNTLEKYELDVLKKFNAFFFLEEEKYPLPKTAIEVESLEDEVVYVAVQIRKLYKEGVPFSNIHLLNVTQDYYYTLRRVFAMFGIPLQLSNTFSLLGTKVVSDYLETKEINLQDTSFPNQKLVQVVNSLSFLEEGDIKQEILIDKLKSTKFTEDVLQEAVQIRQMDDIFGDDDYVFLLGMNQDVFPNLKQDNDFILDIEKKEVALFSTDDKNAMIKQEINSLLRRIPHLFLSYKLQSAFQVVYKSSLIEELNISIQKNTENIYNYSNLYNKLILAEKLDDFYKFGIVDDKLSILYKTYPFLSYHSYSSKFTGINTKELENYLKPVLNLSYTHLQNYYLCSFKYYVNHILKLDSFETTFASIVGTMFHEALKYMYCEDFNLDYFMAKVLETQEFTAKEKFFLSLLKDDLKKTLTIIEEQGEYTKFQEHYLEKDLQVMLQKGPLEVVLKGSIDKIMYYKNISDTYYAVIDYKSGSYDTNLKKIQFGLNMQLPIYLYLVEKSRLFHNSIFTGFYYQKILTQKKSYDKEEETLKLEGYSCDDKEVLQKFDNSYMKSGIIKGLSIKQDGSFSLKSKLLNSDDIVGILDIVEQKVGDAKEKIINGDFAINPKYLDKENISCKYCKYKDLCFMSDKDLVYLNMDDEKVEKELEMVG